MRRQSLICAGVTAIMLASVGDARADNLPSGLQKLSDWTGLIANVYGGGQAIAAVAALFGGSGPSADDQILSQLSTISNQITALNTTTGQGFAGTDFQLKQETAQTLVSNMTALLSNLVHADPMTKGEADYMVRQYLDQAVQQAAFTHGFVDASTNGVISGPANGIGGSAFNSGHGLAWKSVIPDREPVTSDGEFQVYDWRVGVPTLLVTATTGLLVMDQIDPNFRMDGNYQTELQGVLGALQANLATMVDGVRCGLNSAFDNGNGNYFIGSGAGSKDWQYGCADIYSGINVTYDVPALPGAFIAAIQNTPYYPLDACPDAIYLGTHDVMVPYGQGAPFTRTMPVDCSELADGFAQPVTAAARDGVMAQLPIQAMRKLIGLLTQLTNAEDASGLWGQKAWTGCANSYQGKLLLAGDTGCKNLSDITMVPTNYQNFDAMMVASNWGPYFQTYSVATEYWPATPNNNAWAFPNVWMAEATPIAGDFTGDGRWDVALVGGVGWGSIPVAHALGDGTYAVTNHATGVLASNCGFGTAPNSQCSRQNFSTTTPPTGDWSLPGDYTLNFAHFAVGATKLSGDFNGDGFSDIALVGVSGWESIPVAFGDSGGTFSEVTNYASTSLYQTFPVGHSGPVAQLNWFPQWAATPGTTAVVGDFNGDGKSDIALVQAQGTIDVAFSNGDGTFRITQTGYINGSWVSTAGVRVLAGDFDGDGFSDIALAGGSGWRSVPVAFSNSDGTFTVVNAALNPAYASLATNSQLVTGDFDGNHKFDIGMANDEIIEYVSYIPEILSIGRSFVGTSELRHYATAVGDSWSNYYFTALGAN